MSHAVRIVVLGAGYAGLRVARGLATLAKRLNLELTLINRTPCHEVITLLHLEATEGLSRSQAEIPLDRIFSAHAAPRVVIAEVERVDPANRVVRTNDGVYSYDRLVVALGSEPNLPDVPGIAANCFTLRTLRDAQRLRDHIRAMFAAARQISSKIERQSYLRFVVAGGGSTGCQLAGELSHWVTGLADEFRVPIGDIHIMLVDAADRLMRGLPYRFGETALRVLQAKAVDVRRGTQIGRVEPDGLYLEETRLATKTVMCTSGIRAPRLLNQSGLPTDPQGRLRVDGNLRAKCYPEVYVVGDAARFEAEAGKPLAATAAFAVQQGDYVAQAIIADLQARRIGVFRPQDDGMLVSLGGTDAVGKIIGAPIGGLAAGWLKEGIERSYVAGLLHDDRQCRPRLC